MRACIFIDGENFRHSINHMSGEWVYKKKPLPPDADWSGFFDFIVVKASNGEGWCLRTYWYVIDLLDAWPGYLPVPNEASEWVEQHQKDIKKGKPVRKKVPLASLAAKEIVEVLSRRRHTRREQFATARRQQHGIASKHSKIEFRRSGMLTHNLFSNRRGREKTVDVNLAVDMLQFRDNYDLAIVISGDQDHLPAVQAAKNAGKTVVNVAFKDDIDKAPPSNAKLLNETADRSLVIPYKIFAKFLKVPVKKKKDGDK